MLFGEPLNHDQKCELHKKIAGVVSGLAKYGPIKLAHNIKSGDFRVSDKGYTVYRLKDSGILKIIAKNSAKAVTKTNKPKKECLFKLPMCDARDFDPKPNVHISFGKFDPARKINGQKISTHLGRTFLPFSSPKAEMGYTLIDPPNATDNRILDKIYLKQSNGKHYIDRDCWLLRIRITLSKNVRLL